MIKRNANFVQAYYGTTLISHLLSPGTLWHRLQTVLWKGTAPPRLTRPASSSLVLGRATRDPSLSAASADPQDISKTGTTNTLGGFLGGGGLELFFSEFCISLSSLESMALKAAMRPGREDGNALYSRNDLLRLPSLHLDSDTAQCPQRRRTLSFKEEKKTKLNATTRGLLTVIVIETNLAASPAAFLAVFTG